MTRLLLAIAAIAVGTPLVGRDLAVPADKGWQHAETGLVVMPEVAGFRRTSLSDNTASEHDVTVKFAEDADGTFATLYLFRPAAGDAALWFDRAQTTLDRGATGARSSPATLAPVAFAIGNVGAATALRQIYSIAGGPLRSTAVALVPMGEWLVKLRLSSRRLSADRLDARLMALAGALRWPGGIAEATTPIAPTRPCPDPLTFTKAKRAKPEIGELLLGAAATAAADKAKGPVDRSLWCRDGDAEAEYGIYRAPADRTRYVLAMRDAGRVVWVGPSMMSQIAGSPPSILATAVDVDGTKSIYAPFVTLPSPDLVWKTFTRERPMGTVRGKTIAVSRETVEAARD